MNKIKVNNQETILFSTLIFLANPLFGVLFLFHLLISNLRLYKQSLVNLFIIFLAFFLAFINSTKVPKNDLLFHANQYIYAKNMGLLEYLKYIEKEPIGYIFNYIMYSITGGSVKLWVITFSFISYILFFSALKRFYLKIEAPLYLLVLSLVLAAFFPQLFSLSAHLIRQFIASCIFMYFAIDKIFFNKNKYWIVLLGILTHGSSLILYALVYFKFLSNFKKYRVLNIILLLILIFHQKISSFLFIVFGGLYPALDYILKRASRDTTFDLGNFQLMNFVMMIVMVLVVLSSKTTIKNMYKKSLKDFNLEENIKVNYPEENQYIELRKNVKFFFFTMIILSFFILINLKQSELSNRLFFYLFFYFPFIFPLFLIRFKHSALLSYLLSCIFMAYFVFRLEFGVWNYGSLYKLSTNNFFSYFTDPEQEMEYKKFYW